MFLDVLGFRLILTLCVSIYPLGQYQLFEYSRLEIFGVDITGDALPDILRYNRPDLEGSKGVS